MYNVYIEINENKEITKIFSEIFEEPSESSILLDEGEGDKYAHAQGNYFENPLIDDNGNFRYMYKYGKVIEKEG